jgi:FkbM family methyltransferase
MEKAIPKIKFKDHFDLYCINQPEAEFLAGDVESYLKHGIELTAGAIVFDVGANIGLFSASVFQQLSGDVFIYAFEPIPPVYKTLQLNAEEVFGNSVKALPYGLSNQNGQISFTYFPQMTGWSSCDRDQESLSQEKKRMREVLYQSIRSAVIYPQLQFASEMAVNHAVGAILDVFSRIETYECTVKRLSSIIEEEKIERINLLKIDVEGAELDVFEGIDEKHWPMIQQVSLESDHYQKHEPMIRKMLESKGFRVTSVQDHIQSAGDFGMIYALR